MTAQIESGTGVLSRESLADSVYRVVLERLLTGAIEPGSNIRIGSIARELGVSQTPVREALARITENGLIERIPHVGFRAALPFTEKQLGDSFIARLTIEPALAELAAPRMTPEALEILTCHQEQLLHRIDGTTEAPSVDRLQGSQGFHQLIASLADNEPLEDAYHLIHGQAQRIRLMSMQATHDERDVYGEHGRIVDALAAGDAAAAREAMRAHVQAIIDRTLPQSDS